MTVTVRSHEGTLDFPNGDDWVVGEKGELLVTDTAGEEIIAEFTPYNWKGVWKHQNINEQLEAANPITAMVMPEATPVRRKGKEDA